MYCIVYYSNVNYILNMFYSLCKTKRQYLLHHVYNILFYLQLQISWRGFFCGNWDMLSNLSLPFLLSLVIELLSSSSLLTHMNLVWRKVICPSFRTYLTDILNWNLMTCKFLICGQKIWNCWIMIWRNLQGSEPSWQYSINGLSFKN